MAKKLYNKRLTIFAAFCGAIAIICILRLSYMQLNPHSAWQEQLEKIRRGSTKQLPALRGKIFDRKARPIAIDEAIFTLCIDYKYARLADERFWRAETLKRLKYTESYQDVEQQIKKRYSDDYAILFEIIEKCSHFQNKTIKQITDEINNKINKPLWKLRNYIAWKRKYPKAKSFESIQPDPDKRLLAAEKIDLAEMHNPQKFFGFQNDDQVLSARIAFLNTDGIQILPRPKRFYPYENTAAQIIGWVKPWNSDDKQDFTPEELARYQHGDVTGFAGIEYICESILTGKRGEIVYDIDKKIVSQTNSIFGTDITITIDIELQKKIEALLVNKAVNNYFDKPSAAVVIDVNSGDILAMASMPTFDLNTARQNYGKLINDPDRPMVNKAINKNYPPGSTAKPIILAAGLEEKKCTPHEIIHCTATPPPEERPRCWYQKRFNAGHDDRWANEGGNIPRNALRGSCNVYFSKLAVRIDPKTLQKWLWDFGFGHTSLSSPDWLGYELGGNKIKRNFKQTPGIISSTIPNKNQTRLEKLPKIEQAERRFFGIGQGNFRATPLQIANTFATIAGNGIYKEPRLFITDQKAKQRDLKIKPQNIATIWDGLYAVVNESGGTASKQFANSGFEDKGIKVFGKTGSTERPANALFAGFAQDENGNKIALAVIVEGGQHGSSDAAPLGRDIISLCVEQGYLIGN